MESQNCRLCSDRNVPMIDIFSEGDIERKISSYLSLEVRKDNGLSTSICILCYGKLDNFHNFVVNVRKVQEELTATTEKKEILFEAIKLESETYYDYGTEMSVDGINGETVTDFKIQNSSSLKSSTSTKRKKSFVEPQRKSIRSKTKTKKNVGIQVGPDLETDVKNLKKELNLKFPNDDGLEILALLPMKEAALGSLVSKDNKTDKSCIVKLNLGVKTKCGDIYMTPNSTSTKLIKLPPRRMMK